MSSFDLERVPDDGIAGQQDVWSSAASLISSRRGDHASHSALLCSFFTGFGLDAYVALGSKQGSEQGNKQSLIFLCSHSEYCYFIHKLR